jgi:ubiquinone/menaquinone biosynthesis C-methylase UbiE
MATDVAAVLANLLRFYNFGGKTMLSVGAGGGQLAGYGAIARRVIAVDRDGAALAVLAERARELGIAERFVLVEDDFLAVARSADVVLFEFALHEIPDPGAALAHALTLAPDVVVIDHAPDSPWVRVTDEAEKVASSWRAVAGRGVRRREDHDAVQRFASHEEFVRKVEGQGAEALRRAERWHGCAAIEIPMAYAIALL